VRARESKVPSHVKTLKESLF